MRAAAPSEAGFTIVLMSRRPGQIWSNANIWIISKIGRPARRHRVIASICVAAVLLPVLTLAYSSNTPSTYSASLEVAVYAHGADPLTESTALKGAELEPYLAALTSLSLAEAALKRLPEAPPPNEAGVVKASAGLLREVTVRLQPNAAALDLVAKSSSQGPATAIANAFVGALQERRASEAQSLARRAVSAGLELAARLPSGSRARRAAIAAYVRRLVPVLPDRNVQVVHASVPGSSRSLAAVAIAAAIVVLLLLAMLMGTGRYRGFRS